VFKIRAPPPVQNNVGHNQNIIPLNPQDMQHLDGTQNYNGIGDPTGYNPNTMGNQGGTAGMNMGRTAINYGGTQHWQDNSKNVYNTQFTANQQQLLQMQQVQHQQRMMQMEFGHTEGLAQRKFKVFEITNSGNYSYSDQNYIIESLNILLRPKRKYTRDNYQKGLKRFYNHYFKQDPPHQEEGFWNRLTPMTGSAAKMLDGTSYTDKIYEGLSTIKSIAYGDV